MKTKVALMCLGLVSAGFCVDEYLPIAPKTLEIDVGVNPVFGENSTVTGLPVLQAKYGVMPGLDLEAATTYTIGDVGGLVQPDIAAKYAIGATGLAVYGDLALPFATGDRDKGWAGLAITPGVVYGKNYDKIQAVAKASFTINMEDEGVTPDNLLDVYLKPGYMVDDKLAAYLGVDYKMAGDNSSFTLLPGATYTVSPAIALEVNIPIALSDDINGQTSWGVWASVYYTMPL